MIWLNPRTPVIVGIILVTCLGWLLATYSPMPGTLAGPHAAVPELGSAATCDNCHTGEGMRDGCLRCHSEIAGQLERLRGYHGQLSSDGHDDCGVCHPEHRGAEFPLISELSWRAQTEAAFKHPHVEFGLVGAHTRLECRDCHDVPHAPRFNLPAFPRSTRSDTYLGLTQECRTCHEDFHTENLTGDCEACHGQETFVPATAFDHSAHFPLEGGHAHPECGGCHLLPSPGTPKQPFPFPFHEVRGTRCQDCHDSPHRARFAEPCETCHEVREPQWTAAIAHMTRDRHASTGFRLSDPHADLDCASCHPSDLPFEERHPDPRDPGYERHFDSCQGCHDDVHGGQFEDRHPACVDCHHVDFFRPTTFNQSAHARDFPLTGAHQAIACSDCHKVDAVSEVRHFVGTPETCRSCHQSPHGEQFVERIEREDCSACHRRAADSFVIRPFDHTASTGYPLEGGHAHAECNDCHIEVSGPSRPGGAPLRRYQETPQECASCHRDIHLGQFKSYGSCQECHDSFADWNIVDFDHNTQSRFTLTGAHTELECSACHRSVELADGVTVTQYKPLASECRDCHDVPRPQTDR